jgi:hypothetical protein
MWFTLFFTFFRDNLFTYIDQIRLNFNTTFFNKNTLIENLTTQLIFFIRKNRIFNKSRYSRNRQLYRTGVYWCIWVAVFLAYGLFFIFYRFVLTFSYHWWLVFFLLSPYFLNKILKYRYMNFFIFYKAMNHNLVWFSNINTYILNISISKKYIILEQLPRLIESYLEWCYIFSFSEKEIDMVWLRLKKYNFFF